MSLYFLNIILVIKQPHAYAGSTGEKAGVHVVIQFYLRSSLLAQFNQVPDSGHFQFRLVVLSVFDGTDGVVVIP